MSCSSATQLRLGGYPRICRKLAGGHELPEAVAVASPACLMAGLMAG